MQTRLWQLTKNEEKLNEEKLKEAAAFIQKGEVIAFPTETVYGLGANGLDGNAVRKIFAAKGRPADNPLILHIAEKSEIEKLTTGLSANGRKLMQVFWPGPLTLVVPKADIIPDEVSAGLDTVAVRMPVHPVARRLIALSGCPIAAPSANKSGKPSPTNARDVLEDMDGLIAGIIDGGSSEIGVESTVVDTIAPVPVILRPGGITKEMLEEVLGAVEIDPALAGNSECRPKAPGMKYRHYAPKAPMYLFAGEEIAPQMQAVTAKCLAGGKKIGVIADAAVSWGLPKDDRLVVRNWQDDPAMLAENLFTWLRDFDHEKVDVILAQGVAEKGLGLALMNRLRKAAGNNILLAKEQKLFVQSGTRPEFL
ncbi:MAG: L-threonylcarbamoyladenylate synthase [Acidaminococcaceae bacterium]